MPIFVIFLCEICVFYSFYFSFAFKHQLFGNGVFFSHLCIKPVVLHIDSSCDADAEMMVEQSEVDILSKKGIARFYVPPADTIETESSKYEH